MRGALAKREARGRQHPGDGPRRLPPHGLRGPQLGLRQAAPGHEGGARHEREAELVLARMLLEAGRLPETEVTVGAFLLGMYLPHLEKRKRRRKTLAGATAR